MTDLFDEIKEEVRNERYANLWNRFGYVFVSGLLIVILATVAYVWWGDHRLKTNERDSDRLLSFVEQVKSGDLEAAKVIIDAMPEDSSTSGKLIALLFKAGVYSKEGDNKKAAELYSELYKHPSMPVELAELSRLLYVYSVIAQDGLANEELIPHIERLVREDNPWRYFGMEIQAIRYMQMGEPEKSKEIFNALIANSMTPISLKERASEMVGALLDE